MLCTKAGKGKPCLEKSKVHFWPSNSCPSLILAIQLQNRVALTIQLSKPVTFGHPDGFECGFADVDATCQWGPPVSVTSLSLLSISPSFSLLSGVRLRLWAEEAAARSAPRTPARRRPALVAVRVLGRRVVPVEEGDQGSCRLQRRE